MGLRRDTLGVRRADRKACEVHTCSIVETYLTFRIDVDANGSVIRQQIDLLFDIESHWIDIGLCERPDGSEADGKCCEISSAGFHSRAPSSLSVDHAACCSLLSSRFIR